MGHCLGWRPETALFGAAPNPFNPTTTIRFSLARPAGSALEIFDATGRRVRSFDLGGYPAGEGQLSWDGRDNHGRLARSGVYFAQLSSGGRVASGRLVMLK